MEREHLISPLHHFFLEDSSAREDDNLQGTRVDTSMETDSLVSLSLLSEGEV